jgi:outer membrane protein OmpA-like peptidoglycan-associated protein
MKVYIECSSFKDHVGVMKAHVDEAVNRVTMIDLELVSRKAFSNDYLDKLIGVPIKLAVEDVIDNQLHKVRFDGFIFEVINVTGDVDDNGVFYYTMAMRPKLWQLNYSVRARSYPDKSRIEVIDLLLKEHGFQEKTTYTKDYRKDADYHVLNQVLQTGCSDLNFFKSLLINAGINYYFACDDKGEKEEMLHLVDNAAFFPNYKNKIPIVSSKGMMQKNRRVEEVSRLIRAVPSEVISTGFLADGSNRSKSNTTAIENSGTKGKVQIFIPEGLKNAEKTAGQTAKVVAEGFSASRIIHQGATDHIAVRPGRRITLDDSRTSKTFDILVVKAHHTFEQSVLAALSENGSGDPAYKNQFVAVDSMAPVRPMDIWTDVDTEMVQDTALDMDPDGKVSLSPKFKYVSTIDFNSENDPAKDTEAVKELFTSVAMLQAQVRKLTSEMTSLKMDTALGGGGMIAAEVTTEAWVTEGKELVCKVKAEEFQEPITVKVSSMWHTTGGGTQHLPRKGMHVWIQRVARGRDNDWVILGYRPTAITGAVDPAKQTKIKTLGNVVAAEPPQDEERITMVPFENEDLLSSMTVLKEVPPVVAEDPNKPYIVHVRLVGAYFDSSKCFLLPTAIGHIRAIKGFYDKNPNSDLLVVGHTDPTGDLAFNDTLSLERADAMAAYLKDDADAWLAWYGDDKAENKKWGSSEDRLMIKSMPDYPTKPPEKDAVRWYQETRGLKADGIAGPNTRTALIKEYMAQDETTLPTSVSITTHGCGENFPLPEPPPSQQAASDRHSDQEHRRVEFFFFKKPFGIAPPPPGQNSPPGSTQYQEWCRKANERHDLNLEARGKFVTLIEIHDALFRTDSAVVLPEGEDPTKRTDGHLSLSTVGLISSVLRYNQEHPGKQLIVAGHCDTTASIEYNQKLSEERAGTAHAMLVGNRDDFIKFCDGRHDEVDVTQIFDWTTRAYGFTCKPTTLTAKPSDERYKQFRESYNNWINEPRDQATEPDERGGPELAKTGRLDKSIWGAIFDLYEHNLRQELGETASGVADLRSDTNLVWVDPNRQALGFSEHFPIDNLGRDNYRSQANRRVEILFFDPDEIPDLDLGGGAPEMSDIYLPGHYDRKHLDPMLSAMPWKAYWDKLDPPVTAGEMREMILDAPGLPPTTPMVFTVKEKVNAALHTPMPPTNVDSGNGMALLAYDTWFNEEQVTYFGDIAPGSPMPIATFYFIVEGAGRRIESSVLPYSDFVDVVFKHEGTDVLIADVPYIVQTAWATGSGRTDKDGRVQLKDLPPGGAEVILDECYLIEDGKPPVTGGTAPSPSPTQTLKLKLLDQNFSPRPGVPYRLLAEFPQVWEGDSDPDGLIIADIPAALTSIRLIVDECESEVKLVSISDIGQITGVQTRLNNLGYNAGAVDGTMTDQTKAALLQFRMNRGLGDPGTGELLDDATRKSLVDAHGY